MSENSEELPNSVNSAQSFFAKIMRGGAPSGSPAYRTRLGVFAEDNGQNWIAQPIRDTGPSLPSSSRPMSEEFIAALKNTPMWVNGRADTGSPELDEFINTPAEMRRIGNHVVEIHRNPKTHIAAIEIWHNDKGQLDRDDGPAFIARDSKTGFVYGEEWYKNNLRHRADGPAMTLRDENTNVATYESWWQSGQFIRSVDRDPATGKIRQELQGKPPTASLLNRIP